MHGRSRWFVKKTGYPCIISSVQGRDEVSNPDDRYPGLVSLVGGGPGDPGLITLRGAECLRQADVVFYDFLASEELLDHVPPDAERVFVGKSAGNHAVPQDRINALLVAAAREGKRVVRLKGGDPFVFGRGGEECLELASAGIPFEVVPGVSAAMGASAYGGIPLTHRDRAASLLLMTAHRASEDAESRINWEHLAHSADTLCMYMGMRLLPDIVRNLLQHGRSPDTPVAVIQWGTLPRQRTVAGVLKDITGKVEAAGITHPGLIVVGEVVGLRDQLGWFEKRPLFGKRIVVTRWRRQAGDLSLRLQGLGADVIHLPVIEIAPPAGWEDLDRAIGRLQEFAWIVFTSVNGVRFFMERLETLGLDIRRLGKARVCAIGEATASALEAFRLRVDLVPEKYLAETLAEILAGREDLHGKKILLPRGNLARKVLQERLEACGAEVEAVDTYRTLPVRMEEDEIRALLGGRPVDWITFTSSSTVKNFLAAVRPVMGEEWLTTVRFASIGPVTSETLRSCGETPDAECGASTIPALVDAILQAEITR